MASAVKAAKGTTIGYETSPGGGTYTTVAEVISIDGPSLTSDEIDVTNLSSTGGFKETVQGETDPGEISLECNFLPDNATHGVIFGQLGAGTTKKWQIAPNGATKKITFDGWVKSMPMSFKTGQQQKCNVVIRCTGLPTLA